MFTGVCGYMYMYVQVHVEARSYIRCLTRSLSISYILTGVLIKTGTGDSASLASQLAPGTPGFYLPRTGACHSCLALYLGSESPDLGPHG